MEREWQIRTLNSVRWLRDIFELTNVQFTPEERIALYSEARHLTVAQNPDPSRFWGMFVNTLRVLVAGADPKVPLDQIFKSNQRTSQDRDEDQKQCQRVRHGKQCYLPQGHKGICVYEQSVEDD